MIDWRHMKIGENGVDLDALWHRGEEAYSIRDEQHAGIEISNQGLQHVLGTTLELILRSYDYGRDLQIGGERKMVPRFIFPDRKGKNLQPQPIGLEQAKSLVNELVRFVKQKNAPNWEREFWVYWDRASATKRFGGWEPTLK